MSSQEFSYHKVTLFRHETLGSGSYGIVCRAKCDQLVCAAKIMHNALFCFNDPTTQTLLTKFKQECSLLSAAKHPNIVQYLHTYQDPDSGLPVLLMELCDENLTKYLERSHEALPYHLVVDFSADIAGALCYLHANGVIHRDLASNNVLLIGGCRAKVTDFGMSKLVNVNPRLTPLSPCPGNTLYMSPEALQQPPQYSFKLDCFSWGVIAIQIMTRKFPDPGPQFHTLEKANKRIVHEVITEVERRDSHIRLVPSSHPLLHIALKCLSYSEKDRPAAPQLAELLMDLKQTEIYSKSKQSCLQTTQCSNTELETAMNQVQQLSKELRAKKRELLEANQELASIKKELAVSEQYNKECEQTLVDRDNTILTLQQAIEQQQQIIMSMSLSLSEHDDSELQHSPSSQHLFLSGAMSELSSPLVPPRSKTSLAFCKSPPLPSLHRSSCRSPTPDPMVVASARKRTAMLLAGIKESTTTLSSCMSPPLSSPHRSSSGSFSRSPIPDGKATVQAQGRMATLLAKAKQEAFPSEKKKMTFSISREDKAPEKMSRGAAVTQGSKVFFTGFGSSKIHSYQRVSGKWQWNTLPRCPNMCFSLTVISGFVTMVGGCKSLGHDPTATILSLITEGSKKKWVELVPQMPTARQETAVVSIQSFLVVIGGRGKGGVRLNVVEILKLDTKQWQVVGGLPLPLTRPSATLCGDDIYIGAGSPSHGAASKAVYRASLSKLLSPYYNFARGVEGRQIRTAWSKLSSVPANNYSLCTLGNQVVAVGGIQPSLVSGDAIRRYDAEQNEWQVVGQTENGRCLPLVGTLFGELLVVVGGMSRDGNTNTVEVATVKYD